MFTLVYNEIRKRGAKVDTDIVAFNIQSKDIEPVIEALVLAIKTKALLELGFEVEELE